MDCKKAEKLIVSFTDLTPSQKAELEQHLKICPFCAKEFDFCQNSIKMMKKVLTFDVPQNYWDELKKSLSPRLSVVEPQKKSWKDRFEPLIEFLKTPLLGPVPTFVFSIIVLGFLLFGLYPTFIQNNTTKGFNNNLVIYDGELLSSMDNGKLTVYSMGKR